MRKGHVTKLEEGRSAFIILTHKTYRKVTSYEGLGGDGRTILEWILDK